MRNQISVTTIQNGTVIITLLVLGEYFQLDLLQPLILLKRRGSPCLEKTSLRCLGEIVFPWRVHHLRRK